MSGRNLDSRCKAFTKEGKPCRAAATAGGLCFFHANPNKASELGRIGGRSKGPTVPENAEPLPVLDSAMAVREAVDRLIANLYAGKLHPRIAAGLAPLLQLQLRALAEADIERRLSKLERLVARREEKSRVDGSRYQTNLVRVVPVKVPVVSPESEQESSTRFTTTEQAAAPTTETGCNHNPHPQASGAESMLYTMKVEQQGSGNSKGSPHIQNAAARALQAELNEKERDESTVLVRVRDADARALEQNKLEPPQAPSRSAAQQSTTKTGENCEPEVEQILPTGLQQAPPESGEIVAKTSATTTTTPETLEELMKRAQKEWMAGNFLWLGLKQK